MQAQKARAWRRATDATRPAESWKELKAALPEGWMLTLDALASVAVAVAAATVFIVMPVMVVGITVDIMEELLVLYPTSNLADWARMPLGLADELMPIKLIW